MLLDERLGGHVGLHLALSRLGDLRAGSDPRRNVSVARHCARWHAGQRKVQARGARHSVQGSGGGPAASTLICRVRAPGFREGHYPPERQSARACARS